MNGNFTLKVEIKGDKIPDKVFIDAEGAQLPMERKDKNQFTYTFQNVNQSIAFHLEAGKVSSPEFVLHVLKRPVPEGFVLHIIYPGYTGLVKKEIQGLTDVSVPEGTVLKWSVKADYTDKVSIKFGLSGKEFLLQKLSGKQEWKGSAIISKDTSYSIYLSNKKLPHADSFYYHALSVPDEYPRVVVQQFKDSINGQQILLSGQASDDYGLTRLGFHYAVLDANKKVLEEKTVPLPRPNGKIFSFQHYFDLATIKLEQGQQVDYYIAAWDNDGIHGPKKGISQTFVYRMLNKKELDSALNENTQQINQSLSSSANQTETLNKKMEQVREKLLQTQNIGWEQEQNMKSLMEQQLQVKNQLEAIKKRFEQQKRQSEQKHFSEQIKEKQDAVEKQLDQLLNKQLAEQLKKLQDLLARKDKQNAFRDLQQMQQENKLFNMDLERIRELMKKLELQMKLEDMARKLQDLAKQERGLKAQTSKGEKDQAELAKEQSGLKNALQDMMKNDFSAIQKANKAQEQPGDLQAPEKAGQQAGKAMENSESQLKQSQNEAAQKAQENAAQSLDQMASSLMQMASGMDMQQVDIDIRAVRQLLTNLLRFSFEQEKLMNKEKEISVYSPLFSGHAEQENLLKDNARMIKDSLFALSKRLFQLAPGINRETTEMGQNIDR
jgi:hypothetical protein